MACEFVSRANLLDILESVCHNLAAMSSPNYWRYEDRGRAKSYEESLAIVRKYWLKLKNGAEPIKVFDLLRSCKIDYANLVYEALQGNFEKTEDWFRNLPKGHHWVTFGGDFYSVTSGDRLNIPVISRVSNQYLPAEKKKVIGSQLIASIVPNPCTRIKANAQAN